jgi:rare lipoprotein A
MLNWLDDASELVWTAVLVFILGCVAWICYCIGVVVFEFIEPAHAAERGIASVYSSHDHNSRWTASGERMNDRALTAAHRTLPLGTHVRVAHGHRWIVVRINDRGPFRKHRIIDLSPAAAHAIGLPGLGNVELSVVN